MSEDLLTKEQIEDLLENVIGVSKMKQWKNDKIQFCCPVHNESNPSCGVNSNYEVDGKVTQVFNCFSCGANGSLPWLLCQSMPERFSFSKAVKFIEKRYGVDFHHISHARSKAVNITTYEEQFENCDHDDRVILPKIRLAPFKSGKQTFKYFFNRGFNKSDMKEYCIGRDLENKTVTIPAFWQDGQLAGIIGRYIDESRPHNSRYRIYDFEKSKLLYPLDKLEVIEDTIIGVEGQFNAIWLRKWGFPNVLANMGGTISKIQADMIAERCKVFIPLYDNDEGGRKTTEKAIKYLKGKVRILRPVYPDEEYGSDPEEWGEDLTNEIINSAGSIRVARL